MNGSRSLRAVSGSSVSPMQRASSLLQSVQLGSSWTPAHTLGVGMPRIRAAPTTTENPPVVFAQPGNDPREQPEADDAQGPHVGGWRDGAAEESLGRTHINAS